MKLLHITKHTGCEQDLTSVCKTLGHELTTMRPDWSYNIDHDLAIQIWNEHHEYFNSFDVIITSDTAPLSRIFLQNNYQGKLIIWVCNRFDYADEGPFGVNNPHKFPDQEYIDLFKSASVFGLRSSVKVFSYTKFEHEYALKKYGFQWEPQNIIRPCGQVNVHPFVRGDKAGFYFIPPYHNDTNFMNLQQKCTELGITTYAGKYNGIADLLFITGIIHIPYAWSNLALFENWGIGNVYLIPSKDFLLALSAKGNFFWSPPFHKEFIESSEWYLPEHKDLFLYFDSWDHLKYITEHPQLIKEKQELVKAFHAQHVQKTLNSWQQAITIW